MKIIKLLFISMITMLFISCSNDDGSGNINLYFKGSNTALKQTNYKAGNAEVVFTDFKISIRDVVFKNDNDPNSSLDTDEIQFRGPYQIDLLEGSDAITQTIGTTFVPDGLYKELRFKFHKDENLPSTNDLFDRSIHIRGTIDGKPFIFWHDTSENMDVGRSTGIRVINGNADFTVQFNINQFLNSLHQIDLSQAIDGNEDGMIEIFPNDQDGNQSIAKELKDNIKAAADLMNK